MGYNIIFNHYEGMRAMSTLQTTNTNTLLHSILYFWSVIFVMWFMSLHAFYIFLFIVSEPFLTTPFKDVIYSIDCTANTIAITYLTFRTTRHCTFVILLYNMGIWQLSGCFHFSFVYLHLLMYGTSCIYIFSSHFWGKIQ